MNWKEKSQLIINNIIDSIGTADKQFLKERIDEECPFNSEDILAMNIWNEERQKILNPNFSKKKDISIKKSQKQQMKIKDFYDNKEEF